MVVLHLCFIVYHRVLRWDSISFLQVAWEVDSILILLLIKVRRREAE